PGEAVLLRRLHIDQLTPPYNKGLEFQGRLIWHCSNLGPYSLAKEWDAPVFCTSAYGSPELILTSSTLSRGRSKAGAPIGAEATLATSHEAANSAGVL